MSVKLHEFIRVFDLFQLFRRDPFHSPFKSQNLIYLSHLIHVCHILISEACDKSPPVGNHLDQAFLLQEAERLSHRRTADIILVADSLLCELLAVFQQSLQDLFSELDKYIDRKRKSRYYVVSRVLIIHLFCSSFCM